MMMWASLSLATFAGSFITLMTDTMPHNWSENEQLELSLLAMIPLGVGQMLGGLLIGQVVDRLGMRAALGVAAASVTVAIGLMLVYVWFFQFGTITLFVTFLWGV